MSEDSVIQTLKEIFVEEVLFHEGLDEPHDRVTVPARQRRHMMARQIGDIADRIHGRLQTFHGHQRGLALLDGFLHTKAGDGIGFGNIRSDQ